MKISIVTPFYGSGTPDLLPDWLAATEGAERVIVDNATPHAAMLQQAAQGGGIYIRNDENAGFAAANNQGYAAATGDIIVFANSDIAGGPAWLGAVAADVRDGALYGPSLAQQLVYGLWLPYLEGWCVGATKDTWRRLMIVEDDEAWRTTGPWDALAYPGPYWEDNDLCLRALNRGLSLVQTAWPVQHKGGRSAGAIIRWGDTFERNRATFAARVAAVWEGLR